MYPILLDFFGITVSSYAVALSIAVVASAVATVREAEHRDVRFSYWTAVGALLGGLVGARAFWILQFSEWTNLGHAAIMWAPGMVLYGGVLGAVATLVVLSRVQRQALLPVLDVAAPHAALGEGIARIGCFLAGCCWGAPCAVPWGVRFPAGSLAYGAQLEAGLTDASATHSLPVHPTQLYMTVGLAIGYFALRGILHRPHPNGLVLASYLAYYGALRFAVECVRGDSTRPLWGMTLSQAMSVMLLVAGVTAVVVLQRIDHRTNAGNNR
ncbi:MAG: prolipoprotein diacylglyceryl transferase [Candidatus Hydrogenedentes bacterium]|nr:prolipoprotein diacylglyceryl transferase [Candidatus Hydrogenedentota bacterium]